MLKVLLLIALELCNDIPDITDTDRTNDKLCFGWSVLKGVSLFKLDFKV